MSRLPDGAFSGEQGTTLRIGSLRSGWDRDKIENLGADLARLVSPFGTEDFAIRLEAPGRDGTADVRSVRLPEYMSEPKYRIAGTADAYGTIHWRYRYRPIGGSERTGRVQGRGARR